MDGALAALAKDLDSWIPPALTWWLTVLRDSSSRGSDALFFSSTRHAKHHTHKIIKEIDDDDDIEVLGGT